MTTSTPIVIAAAEYHGAATNPMKPCTITTIAQM